MNVRQGKPASGCKKTTGHSCRRFFAGSPLILFLVVLTAVGAELAVAQPRDPDSSKAPGLEPPDPSSQAETAAEVLSEEEEAIEEISGPFPERKPPPAKAEDKTEHVPAESQPEDACDWHLEDQPIQEQSQEVMRSLSCHTFRWFDGWWGESRDFAEDEVRGWMTLGADYRKYDGLDPRMRLRVRAPLPNMNQRWDVLLGRLDEDAYISDTQGQDKTFYNPGVVNRDDEDSWLLGLGHRRKSLKKGWDWSAGVRLRLPPEPYVKLSYFYNEQFTDTTDLRFRQTLFWRIDDGFGTTSRGDLAWATSPKDVLRWEGVATVSEETEGANWYFGQTWYHLLKGESAISLLAFVRGETQAEVALTDFGFNLIWRRPFTRDWLYLSMGPNFTWPRQKADEARDFNIGFGLWIEMEFGNWRY